MMELGGQEDAQILSDREKQILRLIDKGLMSKEICQPTFYQCAHGQPAPSGDFEQASGEKLH